MSGVERAGGIPSTVAVLGDSGSLDAYALYRLDEALDAIEDGIAAGVEMPASGRDAIEHLTQIALEATKRNGRLNPRVYARGREIISKASR